MTTAAEGVAEIAWELLNPAPDVPLNPDIGPHRRYVWVHSHLDDFKVVKDAFGGTVNDVVLAVTAGALRGWLHERGVRTAGLALRALVPVSMRSDEDRGMLGNRLAVFRAPLPVYAQDPVERLRIVRAEMAKVKQSKQVMGAETLVALNDFAPPTMLAQASRLNFSTRLFNMIVTNVPGPQFPLYVLGRELETVVPVAFLPNKHALAVAIFSYNGKMSFGLLGDFDAIDDLDVLRDGLDRALAELVDAARAATAERDLSAAGSRARRIAPGGTCPHGPKIDRRGPRPEAQDPACHRAQRRRGACRRARLHVVQRGDRGTPALGPRRGRDPGEVVRGDGQGDARVRAARRRGPEVPDPRPQAAPPRCRSATPARSRTRFARAAR